MLKIRRKEIPFHLMIFPALLLIVVYQYIPMIGIIISFENFIPTKGFFGSEWIGMENYRYVFSMPDFKQVLWNTVFISTMKIVAGLFVPVTVALLLNEVRNTFVKRGVQTLIYLPHFMSWVLLSGMLIDILSPSQGIVNQVLNLFGLPAVFFLGDNKWFPFTLIITDVWKEFGFGTIVYLAALTGINPSLYEASLMDGANRWKQTWHITIPGILPIVVLMMTLSLGNVLNGGFDQVFNLYSPVVYQSGDILDTMIYRVGLENAQYGVATAVGFFKSIVSFFLISSAYWLAYRFADYRIF